MGRALVKYRIRFQHRCKINLANFVNKVRSYRFRIGFDIICKVTKDKVKS
jgi:hypothetical protein